VTTLTKNAVGTPTTSGSTWAGAANFAGTDDGTVATFTSSVSSATGTIDPSGFDFSSIPAGATINNVTVRVNTFCNVTGRCLASQYQVMDGATTIGAVATGTLTTTTTNVDQFNPSVLPTLAQLQSATFKVRCTARKAASTQSGIISFDFIEVIVDYTAPVDVALSAATITLTPQAVTPTAVGSITPPTFVTDVESAWTGSTSPVTSPSFNGLLGDLVVSLFAEANWTTGESYTGGGSVESWTQGTQSGGVNSSDASADSAYTTLTADRTGMTANFARSGGSSANAMGLNASVWRDHNGVGNVAAENGTGTDATGNSWAFTTNFDNSAIVCIFVDWGTVDGSSRVWRTVNGFAPSAGNGKELAYFRNTTDYAVYVAYYPDAGAAGSKTLGLSTPTGGTTRFVAAAVEIRGKASGAASVALAPATITLSPQPVQPSRSVALSPATITLNPQPLVPSQSVALSPATITLSPQPVLPQAQVALAAASLTLAPGQLQPSRTVALAPATLTLSPQAIVATPSVALAPVTITLTPQPISPAGTGGVALAAATMTLSPQPLVPSQSVALAPATITLAPQPVQPSQSVALSAVTITLAPQPIVATPSVALSAAQITLTPQPLSPSLPGSVALSPVTITLAPQPLRPSQSVQLAAATLTLSPAPLQPSQSVALAPVIMTLTATPLVISGQAVTISLVPATITLTPRSLVPTPSVTLNPVTLTLVPISVSPVPSVALAPVILTLSPRPLGVSQNVQLVAVQLTLAPQPVFVSGVPPKFLTLTPVMIKLRARPLRPKAIPVEYEFVVRLDRAPELVTVDRAPVDVRLEP
jgi:hypothetical protein